MECKIPDETNESILNTYFRDVLFKLTEISYHFNSIRHLKSIEFSLLYFKCLKATLSGCKSRCLIIFDKKNKVANIYQNEEKHSHIIDNIFIRKRKMDVI